MSKSQVVPQRKASRRQEYADQTRQAIIQAARKLFSERGYVLTRVEDIATLARVAPITVYTGVGGKAGLLHILMEMWIKNPVIEDGLSGIQAMEDPRAIVNAVARATRSMREEFDDIMYIILDAAPHNPVVAETLAVATSRYRQTSLTVSQHLAALGALRKELTVEDAADVIWFYFGYRGWSTLHNENQWTYEKAEQWLAKAASHALLQDVAPE